MGNKQSEEQSTRLHSELQFGDNLVGGTSNTFVGRPEIVDIVVEEVGINHINRQTGAVSQYRLTNFGSQKVLKEAEKMQKSKNFIYLKTEALKHLNAQE